MNMILFTDSFEKVRMTMTTSSLRTNQERCSKSVF